MSEALYKKILVSKDAALWQLLISLLFSDWCMGCETRDYLKYDTADANFMRRELKFTLLQNLMSRKKSKAPQTDCASSFFLPVFYLKTPTARVWTAASLQPLCLLAASLCFATPNMMKRAFWGVRWGDWSYSAFPTRGCVSGPFGETSACCRGFLKKKIIFVRVSRVNYTTNT